MEPARAAAHWTAGLTATSTIVESSTQALPRPALVERAPEPERLAAERRFELVEARADELERRALEPDERVERRLPLEREDRRRFVAPLRNSAGISSFATAWDSFGISLSRNPACASPRAGFARQRSVSRSPTVFASVSIAV